MSSTSWIRIACAAIAGLVVGRLLLSYDAFPDPMGSHFDGAGRPISFMSKKDAVTFAALLQVIIPAWMLASRWLFAARPDDIRLPHRGYYLAPERRSAALERLASLFDWMALAVALLVRNVEPVSRKHDRTACRLAQCAIAFLAVFIRGWWWSHRAFRGA